jgi:hypothetical protein
MSSRRYKDTLGEPASSITTSSFKNQLCARTGEGVFYSLFGYCSGAAQFCRLYDGVSQSGRLLGVFAVPSANNFSLDVPMGLEVTDGIFAALSTSSSSYVAAGNDAVITITFK